MRSREFTVTADPSATIDVAGKILTGTKTALDIKATAVPWGIISLVLQSGILADSCLSKVGVIMNSKAVFVTVIAVLFLFVAAMMWELAGQGETGVRRASAEASAGGVVRVTGTEPGREEAQARQIDAALAARITTLERAVTRLDYSRVLDDLRDRVADLERTMRDGNQGVGNTAARSQANDISRLKGDHAALQRSHTQLASKVSSAQNKASPDRNDLRLLQQKVFSLETKVQRLESR